MYERLLIGIREGIERRGYIGTFPHYIQLIYEQALNDILKRIEERGYITFFEAHEIYVKLLDRFFAEWDDMEPLTEHFESYIYDEFFKRLEGIEGLKKREFPGTEEWREELSVSGVWIYGFDEERIERGYQELMESGPKNFLKKLKEGWANTP